MAMIFFLKIKQKLFWGEGGDHRNFMEHFLFLSVVSYWFEIAVRIRRECLAKTVFIFILLKPRIILFLPLSNGSLV
jgi:hypothetical protein